MSDDPHETVRASLIQLGRRRREVGLPRRGRPSDWKPYTVWAEDDQVFTLVGAWEFVLRLLEEGQPLEMVSLDHPPGKIGWVMKKRIRENSPVVYMKVEMGSGALIGRSFHYSYHDARMR